MDDNRKWLIGPGTDLAKLFTITEHARFVKRTFFFLLLWSGIAVAPAHAADHYVRANAVGSADGTDWTNAYTALPASLTRGDTYFIGDGSYPGHVFDAPTSGSTLITIKKATVVDHGTDSGWAGTYGDGQAAFSGQLVWATDYWVFDGQVGGGPGTTKLLWTTGYGFKVTETSGFPVLFVNRSGNVTISHVEAQGAGRNGTGDGDGNDGLQSLGPTGPVTISHAYLHDMGRTIFYVNGAAAYPMTAEYVYTGQHESSSGEHSEMTVIHSAATFIMRWSIITHEEGTGGVIGGDDCNNCRAEIYGNIFFNNGELPPWETENNGLFATDSSGRTTDWKVYNNTFINLPSGLATFGTLGTQTGHVAANNYFYLSPNHDASDWGTERFDHFQNSGSATGTDATSGNGNPFVNYPVYDFRLNAATTPGQPLPPPYDIDMFGTRRGFNGNWGRGAIEFTGTPVNRPSAPRNLRVIP